MRRQGASCSSVADAALGFFDDAAIRLGDLLEREEPEPPECGAVEQLL